MLKWNSVNALDGIFMMCNDIYLYSPLSIESVQEGEGRSLLLQFILFELFCCVDFIEKKAPFNLVLSTPARFFPFDWSYEVGCLNKIQEHSQLLPYAFSEMQETVDDFLTIHEAILIELTDKKNEQQKNGSELIKALEELFERVIPFMIACKESENLVLFLLRHSKEINALLPSGGIKSLLKHLFPDRDFANIRNRYDLRGFSKEKEEFNALISPYER